MIGVSGFGGVQMIVTENAMERVTHWPVRQRSARLHKKMTKKRGPQFTEKPGAFKMADGRMIIHPQLYHALKQRTNGSYSAG
jgi:hypothetical protein